MLVQLLLTGSLRGLVGWSMRNQEKRLDALLQRVLRISQREGLPPPAAISMERAAAELGLTPRSVSRLARRSLLSLVDVGGEKRVPVSELERLRR